ncbi:MAG: flagellar protein FlgN [Methylophaga sp.]|nr:flagellar protein FlgN [Methylophaga sp.]
MAMTSLQQIQSILQAELDTASQLLVLLKGERNALTESNADVMNEMSAKKQPLLVKLEQLGRQRESVLQTAGFSSGKEGLEAFVENQTAQDAHRLNRVLDSLREAAQGCRENNQINGGIVNVNRQYLQKAMSILRGRDVNPSSYGPGGEYTSQVVRQPLLGRV